MNKAQMKVFLIALIILVYAGAHIVKGQQFLGIRLLDPHVYEAQPPENKEVKRDVLTRDGTFAPEEQRPVKVIESWLQKRGLPSLLCWFGINIGEH